MFERPKNAYEACLMAADMIENHPDNYVQDVYRARLNDYWVSEMDAVARMLTKETNICHTAYCRAGWICLLAQGTHDPATGILSLPTIGNDWETMTEYLLGLKYMESIQGSSFTAAISELVAPYANKCEFGTEEYPREGAAGLRRFAEIWRGRLEAVTYPRSKSFAEWKAERKEFYRQAEEDAADDWDDA